MKPMPESSITMLAVITSEVSTREVDWRPSPSASTVASIPPAVCW